MTRALALVGESSNVFAAEELGVSEGTIRRWRAGDISTPLRIGTRLGLIRYIEEREGAVAEDPATPPDELDNFVAYADRMVRQASGEAAREQRRTVARIALTAMLQMAREDGNEPLAARVRAELARLGPPPEATAPIPSQPNGADKPDMWRRIDEINALAETETVKIVKIEALSAAMRAEAAIAEARAAEARGRALEKDGAGRRRGLVRWRRKQRAQAPARSRCGMRRTP